MRKFEIRKCERELSSRNHEEENIIDGITMDCDSYEEEVISSFETKSEALCELSNYKSNYRLVEGNVNNVYLVEEHYLSETHFEENSEGEYELDYSEVWEFARWENEQ